MTNHFRKRILSETRVGNSLSVNYLSFRINEKLYGKN